jgi:hypothetical protein
MAFSEQTQAELKEAFKEGFEAITSPQCGARWLGYNLGDVHIDMFYALLGQLADETLTEVLEANGGLDEFKAAYEVEMGSEWNPSEDDAA